jgi:hypothetical protein
MTTGKQSADFAVLCHLEEILTSKSDKYVFITADASFDEATSQMQKRGFRSARVNPQFSTL